MDKEEFIQKSALMNLQAAWGRWSDTKKLVKDCYETAIEMADLVYGPDKNNKII
jgi:hypothetical protein